MAEDLTEEQKREAAEGDVNVLAILMLIGSSVFSAANLWIGTMNWIAAVLSVMSTLAWSLGLWRRSPVITSFVKVGFGFGGLAAPLIGLVGIVLGIIGITWGWALLAAAVVYLGFSVLGLEIIERAHNTGAIERYSFDERNLG